MEKKKNSKNFIIPASYFFKKGITPIPVTVPEKQHIPAEEVEKKSYAPVSTITAPISKNTAPKVEPEITEIPKITLNSGKKATSGLSLKSIQAKKDHQIKQMEVVIDEENLPKDDFTESDLISYWNIFIKQLEENGQFNLASILSIDTPKVVGTTIYLEFPNSTNKVEVERQQYDLMMFLKKSLNNYDLHLSIDVNEEMEKQYAYTTREKYDKLLEKNPAIETLRKTFDLDI
jgi:DNA polymerase-3 subunit gamma/tau